MRNKSIVIAGYGSIGKKYADVLLKKNFDIIVFDPKIINKKNKKIIFLNTYKLLLEEIKKRSIKVAIISSLANTHYKNFNLFVENGIDRILIEKPVTNNISEYNKIINFKKKKIYLLVLILNGQRLNFIK